MGIVALLVGLPGLDLRTWLIVLFQINAGIGTLPGDPLRVFNTLDVAVLVLAAVAFRAPGRWFLRGGGSGRSSALPFHSPGSRCSS
jgi:hypothetical protein